MFAELWNNEKFVTHWVVVLLDLTVVATKYRGVQICEQGILKLQFDVFVDKSPTDSKSCIIYYDIDCKTYLACQKYFNWYTTSIFPIPSNHMDYRLLNGFIEKNLVNNVFLQSLNSQKFL